MLIRSRQFDFRLLVLSHGWAFLPPFRWDDATGVLERPLRLEDGQIISVALSTRGSGADGHVHARIHGERRLSTQDRCLLRQQIVRMLRLDESFDAFQGLCASDPLLTFVAKHRCGGLLRAPTAFEDLVKTACTTNCDWNNTKRMCQSLCALENGGFPGPEIILKHTATQLSRMVPLGYRVRTLREIAERTAAGGFELDQWAAAGEFEKVDEALRSIWGIGPYAAAHMLVLLGCYTRIPMDSEVNRYMKATHAHDGIGHSAAAAHYDHFHPYQFLAYKFSRIGRKMNYIDK